MRESARDHLRHRLIRAAVPLYTHAHARELRHPCLDGRGRCWVQAEPARRHVVGALLVHSEMTLAGALSVILEITVRIDALLQLDREPAHFVRPELRRPLRELCLAEIPGHRIGACRKLPKEFSRHSQVIGPHCTDLGEVG